MKAGKIKKRLLMLHKENKLNPPLTLEEEVNLNAFTASESWARKVAQANGWRSIVLHGEAGKVDVTVVADEMGRLRALIATYKPENVYNMDETGLLYKCLPNRSYVKEEDIKTARGTAFMMNDKNRTTLYVTSNADGSDLVPLSMIGKAKKPNCFRGRNLKLTYYDQKKAWSDTRVFKLWWNDFLLHIRSKTNEPVLLILDNCGPHAAECVDDRNQVKVVFLPPNTTSVYQPMDAGVIAMIKRRYRYRLLARYLEIFETRQMRREQAVAAKMTRGTMGLDEGYPPHLRDAMDVLHEVQRKDVTAIKLHNCWKKSTLLDGYVNYPHPNTATVVAAPVAAAPSPTAAAPVAPDTAAAPAAAAPAAAAPVAPDTAAAIISDGTNNAKWLYSRCSRARTSMGTSLSTLDLCLKIFEVIKETDDEDDIQIPLMEALKDAKQRDVAFILELCGCACDLRDDDELTEEALRNIDIEEDIDDGSTECDVRNNDELTEANAPVEAMDIDESPDDNQDEDDIAEIVNGIMKLASLVMNERKNSEETDNNEMEFMFDELVETTVNHGQGESAMKEMLEGWVSMETNDLIVEEERLRVEKYLDDDALCGIAVYGEESDDEDDDEIVAKEPFTDDDINEVTEQLKRHATFLQTDCSGAFDKAAVALMDAASSILRTNRNLKGKSLQKKQSSGRQTGIMPFAQQRRI